MKRIAAILVAGCGAACLFSGCTHTHRLDGLEIGEPEKPAIAAPLKVPLTEQEVVQAAVREAERRRIPLQEFKGPHVQRLHERTHVWSIIYNRDLFPGDYFMVVVNALTGETEFVGGQ
jgi:hypothetical protein